MMGRALFAIFLTFWLSFAQAAAVPAYTGRVNNSIGSIIQQKVGKWGFAANDPRFGATINAVSTAATTVAAGVATGAIATVGWPALLIGAGVSAVVGGAVSLGMDGLISWLWPDSSHENQTQVSGVGMGGGDPRDFAIIPGTYLAILDAYGGGADIWFAQDSNYAKARHIKTVQIVCPSAGSPFCSGSSVANSAIDYTFTTTYGGPYPGTNGYYANVYRRTISTTSNPITSTVQIVFDFVPPSGVVLLPPSYMPKWQAAGQSINDLPQSYSAQPLSDAQLAVIANTLWKNAQIANNPNAIPWNQADPITSADIASWRAANPQLVPTVNDFISPVTPPGSTTVPISNPGTDGPPVSPPGTEPTPSAPIEWGTFSPPTLDETPSTASILDPIFNMWPQWNNYAFPAHSAECPKPTFVALGHTFTFDHMCSWTEMVRPAVQAAFALIWALMVIFIVMGA